MINLLAFHYRRLIAAYLLLFFSLSQITPLFAGGIHKNEPYSSSNSLNNALAKQQKNRPDSTIKLRNKQKSSAALIPRKAFTSGPSQPEMSTFKPVDATNLVNLFTGDFSYNIPLMDVGGYPVNIFYDGGITMEQEASWVGLGWNINPGSISRNMRGVPDDFNGTEKLTQTQLVKPNITWGVNLDGSTELMGIDKAHLQTSFGLALNNYLGPSVSLGVSGGYNLFSIPGAVNTEKNTSNKTDTTGLDFATVDVNLKTQLDSRSGLTISPSISLTANNFLKDKSIISSVGLSTSYNSRTGLKDLELYDQMSVNKTKEKQKSFFDRLPVYNSNLASTAITFARPSYLPTIRMPITNMSGSGRFKAGGGIFGGYASAAAEVYKEESSIEQADMVQTKPLIGYLNYDKLNSNPNAVTDFTRLNDREVTANTPIISAPQYTYDIFSIQGEGTGGTFRAYRNDIGYVRDNLTVTKDKSNAVGVDVGPPGHYGVNFNQVTTPTTIGEWNSGNHLRSTAATNFTGAKVNDLGENIYFRNPGENSIINPQQYDNIGGTNLVRFVLGGTNGSPTVEPSIQQFSKSGSLISTTALTTGNQQSRIRRSQVITCLTADEASKAGLDKVIKSYNTTTVLDANNMLQYDSMSRVDNVSRFANHISEINILEGNGKRYIYGLPIYNLKQIDFSFSVGKTESIQDPGKVDITSLEPDPMNNPYVHVPYAKDKDGYYQSTETPAYAHAFLLTGLLSDDYVDVTNNGITEDDLGTAVKFNYTKVNTNYKWRTPIKTNTADFNKGLTTETKDDKGMISYGERESWYLHSIESKTMIAIFKLASRDDANGVVNPFTGGLNQNDNALRQLKQIDLYSKSDLKKNGLLAKPIKTVHFEYDYTLCKNTPDNGNVNGGKLTLKEIWFSYNGQERTNNKSHYLFSYEKAGKGNPNYVSSGSDRWGSYKPYTQNPQGMKNADYPYALQDRDATTKDAIKDNAGAWMLKSIVLPSGGQMDMDYESDDYAFVQNKRAATMMTIAGFGSSNTQMSNNLYENVQNGSDALIVENNFVFINIPEALQSTNSADITNEILNKYLDGVNQLAFKLAIQMPKGGYEYISCYANFDTYGLFGTAQDKKIWIHLLPISGVSPLSLTAAEFMREQLPGQAFPGYDISDGTTLEQIGHMAAGLLSGLVNGFTGPLKIIREAGNAKSADITQSFIRLNDPDGYKYGGGYRVRSIKLYNNWDKMTGQYASVYGQQYSYTTTEVFNGQERTISSGVASYEPQIGGEENPFQTIVQVKDRLPLGPASYGAIEMPVLDAFFPAPVVGYSKVTVRSIKNNVSAVESAKIRSGVGKQVTEFYTAKDFPVYYSYTPIDPASEKQSHVSSTDLFFYKFGYDSRAISQGFLVAINDMHGKMKTQSSYAENDENTPLSYTKYYYNNTGSNGLSEKFDFVDASQGGVVVQGNMGIDVEMMNDVREFSVKSNSFEIQGQLDQFPILAGLPWIPFIWPVAGNTENTYRAVTTTKVISYHSMLTRVVAMDKGSVVSTKNVLYDSETGDVLLTQTNNEFDKPVYNFTYPAWWAYSGMGPAYKNINAVYNASFINGKISSTGFNMNIFESGDVLYLINPGTPATDACASQIESYDADLLWAYDKNKDLESLTSTPDFVFLDGNGNLYNRSNVQFKIIRSGKRNLLDDKLSSITLMTNPVSTSNGVSKIIINGNSKVVAANAVEFKEKWQIDNNLLDKYKTVYNFANCSTSEVEDCSSDAHLDKSINPYCKGLMGNYKSYRSLAFYENRTETDPLSITNITQNGFLNNFKLYWDFNTSNKLLQDNTSTTWVPNNQVTRVNARGMETETKNALNIYTAAQYAYDKSLPVAITNNSNQEQAFYEGFEDSYYDGSLHTIQKNNCAPKFIDLTTCGSVVKAADENIQAHTGKYVLKVSGNPSSPTSFAVTGNALSTFNLNFGNETQKTFTSIGYNINDADQNYRCDPNTLFGSSSAKSYFENHATFTSDGFEITGITHANESNCDYNIPFSYYIVVPATGTYTLFMTASAVFPVAGQYGFDPVIQENISISTLTNVEVLGYQWTNHKDDLGSLTVMQNSLTNPSVTLCKGVYQVKGNMIFGFNTHTPSIYANNESFTLSLKQGNIGLQCYKNYNTQCPYVTPIKGDESMRNPVFTIPTGKKMLFSAWVKEKCGDPDNGVPCKLTTYANDKVQITDGNGTLLKELVPTGPILEGWQRYEGDFTVSQGSKASLYFYNSSGNPIYLDDIRIHPFNAMMKSYVYDDTNLRLTAELDENNYARFYEYDEEGTLIRTKAETRQGVKTLTETRSATAQGITQTDH